MARPTAGQAWVDRYLRDELTASEIAEFERTLMDSPDMQQELETALALREMLKHDADLGGEGATASRSFLKGLRRWRPTGLAAAIALAVLSTAMFWKVSSDSEGLRQDLVRLNRPVGNILNVPVDLMRSASGGSPDVVVQKPAPDHGILLSIELAPRSLNSGELAFSLSRTDGERIAEWRGAPTAEGRAEVLFRSDQLPAARMWLDIASSEGNRLERRLLEFR